jgi:hypothetical protein
VSVFLPQLSGKKILPCLGRIILSSVVCLALPYFPTLSPKRHGFPKRKLLNIKCVFWRSIKLISETSLILRKIHVHSLHVKYPLLSSDFNQTGTYSTDFQISSTIKLHENPFSRSRDVPCEQTDTTKLIAVFRNLQKRLKTNELMFYGEAIAVCLFWESYKKHTQMNNVARILNIWRLHLVIHKVSTVI